MPTPNPYFLYPFCSQGAGGDITPIDNTGADSGIVNYQYGWTPNYEYPSSNPDNLPVPRQEFNQLLFDITYALQQLQTQGYPLWVAPATGSPPVGGPVDYPIYSVVAYDAGGGIKIYESQISNNTSVPGADSNWVVISGAAVQIQPGMILDYAVGGLGVAPPTGYLYCEGSPVPRVTYANLFNAITYVQSCTTVSTSTTVTVANSAVFFPGMPIEGSGIQALTTVATIVSPTSITISLPATASATVNLRFFPWGAGDGSMTFNVPNLIRRTTMGCFGSASNVIGAIVGQSGGGETHLILPSEMAPHSHSYAVPALIHNGAFSVDINAGTVNASQTTGTTPAVGTQTAMTIMQPTSVVAKIIKI